MHVMSAAPILHVVTRSFQKCVSLLLFHELTMIGVRTSGGNQAMQFCLKMCRYCKSHREKSATSAFLVSGRKVMFFCQNLARHLF